MRNQKLSQNYFGPFPVEAKIGEVAYKLTLPMGARIHSTFHVSQLKKHIGSAECMADLPPVGSDGAMLKEPVRIINRRMIKKGNHAEIEVLVEWADTFPKDATWKIWSTFQQQYPTFDP